MAPEPIKYSATNVDLSPRVLTSTTVVASPAAASETIICSLTIAGNLALISGVAVFGYAAFLVGASGTDATLKIRRTDASGQTVVSSGLINAPAAADLLAYSIQGFDSGAAIPQVYVLTLTIANGAATSTVSATSLIALAV